MPISKYEDILFFLISSWKDRRFIFRIQLLELLLPLLEFLGILLD